MKQKNYFLAFLVASILLVIWILISTINKNSSQANQTHSASSSSALSNPTTVLKKSILNQQVSNLDIENKSEATADSVSLILDQSKNADARRTLLQQIVDQGPKNTSFITYIASKRIPNFPNSRIPHTFDNAFYAYEKNLRITAIETLDKWASEGYEVRNELHKIIDTQNDSDLVFLATLSLNGINEGRPGKLGRFIETVFNESEIGR